jgi:hypothetical protein
MQETERTLYLPDTLDVLKITGNANEKSVRQCEDGTFFVFPIKDCAMLPLVHATAEELSIYLLGELPKA